MRARVSAVIIYAALFERSVWRYRQRGYRYVYIEAGHMAQNRALASISLGLGCCHVGALFDLSLIHISEPTRLLSISYAVFCLKKKKKKATK